MRNTLFYILFVVVLASCSEYSKVLKNGTTQTKWAMADTMYNKKDYVRALPLYEELLDVYRGKPESEAIYFKYCYSNYYLGQFELAAFHFSNFVENYYNSKHLEECSFMYAKCIYGDALDPELDQTNTSKAIVEIQNFLNNYPFSSYKEECNTLLESLRKNLMYKSYKNGMLYFKMGDYTATIVSLKNTLKDFPDVPNKSEIEFTILKSTYLLAKHSVLEKKEARYKDVFDAYNTFIRNNPGADKLQKEAAEINEKAKLELANFQKLNNNQ
ncbi:MAG TPA: outer membrane protein assembly factor BamD [Bacteroidia bacterium]